MTPQQPTLVSTKEADYLDEDSPLRGQNYVCLSFISPEEILANKDVWVFERYMEAVGGEIKGLLDGLEAKYPDDKELVKTMRDNYGYLFTKNQMQEHFRFFKDFHGEKLEKEFHEANNFRTSVRGIKVRGVFDTLQEAQKRAEYLKKQGDKFDIFIGQVGVWCPWSPNPSDIQNQEYTETQLNTIMKQYKENMETRDMAFEERRQRLIEQANVRSVADSMMEGTDVPTSSQAPSQ